MKKVLLLAGLAGAAFLFFGGSSASAQTPSGGSLDQFEGKAVNDEANQHWYLVQNGKKYGIVNSAAYAALGSPELVTPGDAILASIPDGGWVDESGRIINS